MGQYTPELAESLALICEKLDNVVEPLERIATVLEVLKPAQTAAEENAMQEELESTRKEGEIRGRTNERAEILTWLDRHPNATAKQAAEAIRDKLIGKHDAPPPSCS